LCIHNLHHSGGIFQHSSYRSKKLQERRKNGTGNNTAGLFLAFFKKLKLKEFSKTLELKFQEKLKNPAIQVCHKGQKKGIF